MSKFSLFMCKEFTLSKKILRVRNLYGVQNFAIIQILILVKNFTLLFVFHLLTELDKLEGHNLKSPKEKLTCVINCVTVVVSILS